MKIGIIICDRYKNCTGGKCLRSIKERAGAFQVYKDRDVELVSYTTCGGCPGENIEYASEEMKKNDAEIIHFATGMVVGYPLCPYVGYIKKSIEIKYGLKVVVGTYPVPEKYYRVHTKLNTCNTREWGEFTKPTLKEKELRLAYG
ncbi:CGGC domain-containing protein [Melioribacter sp. OK-6-Me]|uniref:CGGC domain-containing protein n=1 Tax=unclassified Melioribacter TaxID=2627329 RepID=UPI003ED9216A